MVASSTRPGPTKASTIGSLFVNQVGEDHVKLHRQAHLRRHWLFRHERRARHPRYLAEGTLLQTCRLHRKWWRDRPPEHPAPLRRTVRRRSQLPLDSRLRHEDADAAEARSSWSEGVLPDQWSGS